MSKHPIKPLILLAAVGSLTAHLGAAWLSADIGLEAENPSGEPLMLSVVIPETAKPVTPIPARSTTPKTSTPEIVMPALSDAVAQPEEPAQLPTEVAEAQTPSVEDAKAPSPVLAPDATQTQPKSGVLVFDMYLGAAEGEPLAIMTHELKFTEQGYEISSRGEALGLMAILYSGLLTQRSVGVMTNGGFSPQHYSEQKGKKPETTVLFDRNNTSIQFGNSPRQPLPENTQDRLSVIYALSAQLREYATKDLLPKQGDVVKYKVANTQNIEDFDLECLGYETVVLPNRETQALKFRRTKQTNSEKTSIELWFSPKEEWLPIQIRLTDKKGMVFTQRLHS
jgi:hypothetical protein